MPLVSAVQVAFRILSATCSLTRALSQIIAHVRTISAPRPSISAEGLHFSAFSFIHSFILSVMRELTSPAIERVKNKLTYPAADEGQKICGIFSETALFKSYGVKKPTS